MLIYFAAVVTLLDSPGQTPTQASKWENENEASTFLLFTLCQWIPKAVCASFKKWVEFTRKQTKKNQSLNFLIRH